MPHGAILKSLGVDLVAMGFAVLFEVLWYSLGCYGPHGAI
jgi:hypothetical protein